MPSLTPQKTGQAYWRSLDELANSSEFRKHLETEFPHMAELLERSPSRRQFLKVMGASLALAGLTGCRWPKEAIVPHAKNPPNRTPGIPVSYATTFALSGVGTGLLVTSYDGRPIKIEGNPLHPYSLGATDAMMQAAILETYDPDRSQFPHEGARAVAWNKWDAAIEKLSADLKASQGVGLAILSEPNSSPTLEAARAQMKSALPKAKWFEYEPLSRDNERVGTAMALGQPMRPLLDLSGADVIASFDCDFLFSHPSALRNTREFARRRGASDGTMNRLYVIENNLSLTGTNADERYAMRAGDIAAALGHVAAELIAKGVAIPSIAAAVQKLDGAARPKWAAELAGDLLAAKGKSVVLVGPRQPGEAHAMACAINAALGNVGKTVRYLADLEPARPTHVDAIAALADGLDKGEFSTLVILGGNPVHDAPADLGFAQKIGKAKTSVRVGLYRDETSLACGWHVPAAHFLEAWGDQRAWDGTVSIQQPLIEPLYSGKSPIEVVAGLCGDKSSGYELVRKTFKERFAGTADLETAWNKALHDGVIANSALPTATPAVKSDFASKLDGVLKPAAGSNFEIVFAGDLKMYDGRFVNNGWLQELPDPITKMTWDNAAHISPADARKMGIKRDDRVDISIGGKTLNMPVCVVPGHAPGSITLTVGWGRMQAGVVAKKTGFDVYPLRSRAGFHIAGGATMSSAGRKYKLVTTQDHHGMVSS
ncbi:MAG: TAT-variant-translocated molybdopterin oxidoreductase, partial [Phycisphaerae bacterium]